MPNAISDVGVTLYAKIGAATKYTPFLKIKSAPASGGAPNKLDKTTLDQTDESFILGRGTTPDMEFEYNYTEANFSLALTACTEDAEGFLVIYSDGTGNEIIGQARTWIEPVQLNSVIMGKLFIAPESTDYRTSAEVTALIT